MNYQQKIQLGIALFLLIAIVSLLVINKNLQNDLDNCKTSITNAPPGYVSLASIDQCWFDFYKGNETMGTMVRVWNVTMPESDFSDCQILKERCLDSYDGMNCKWFQNYLTCECHY